MSKLASRIMRFAIIMIITGLVIGVFYREFSKKLLFKFPIETQALVGHHLSLAHGHTLLIGGLIPLFLAFSVFMLKEVYSKESELGGTLSKVFTFYMTGAVTSLLLLYYKGISHIYLFSRSTNIALDAIDKGLFFGSDFLRIIIYLICHALWGVSLIYFLGMVFVRVKDSHLE